MVAIGNHWHVVDFDLMLLLLRLAIRSRVLKLASVQMARMVSAFDQTRVELLLHHEMRLRC